MNAERDQLVQKQLAHCRSLLDAACYAEAAALLSKLADSLFQAGFTHPFLELFDRLPAQEHARYPELVIAAGDAWRFHNNWQRAGSLYQQAQRLAQANADSIGTGRALSNRALLCWMRGDAPGAFHLYEQAKAVLAPVADQHAAWEELRSGYALVLSSLGQLDEAERLLHHQLRTFQRCADVEGQRMTLHNLGLMIYLRRGDFQAAEAALCEALHLAQETQQRFGEAYLLNSLAYTLNWQARPAEALPLALRAQAIGEELGVPNVIAFACLNQTQALYRQGDWTAAEHACERALAQLHTALSSPLRCDILLMQAQLQQSRCRALALQTAQAALATARVQADRWMVGLCLLQVAELSLQLDQSATAGTMLTEALPIFERYGDRYHLLRWHLLSACLARTRREWSQLGRHSEALLTQLHQYPALVAEHASLLAELLGDTLRHNPRSAALLQTLADAWGSSFTPLATALFKHSDVQTRRWTAQVLSGHDKPWAWDVLAAHADLDPAVQATIHSSLARAASYPLLGLELTCLGVFAVKQGGLPIAEERWCSLHAQLVLTYLVLRGSATRDELIDLLWRDEDPKKTGTRLRATMRLLRKALCPPWQPTADYILYQNERYRLAPTVRVTSDVQQFQHWIRLARQQCGGIGRYNACKQALALYGDEFLPGWYNVWAIKQREQLTMDFLWAKEEYTSGLLLSGKLDEAEMQARQIISADPFRERAWQLLMRVLQQQGRTAEAVRAYHTLAQQLYDELGIEPAPETQHILALLRGSFNSLRTPRLEPAARPNLRELAAIELVAR